LLYFVLVFFGQGNDATGMKGICFALAGWTFCRKVLCYDPWAAS